MFYKNICPRCGFSWNSTELDNACPNCRYWSILSAYEEGANVINELEYRAIKTNVHQDHLYELECEECSEKSKLYFDKWGRCHCGGILKLPEDKPKQPSITSDELKALRKGMGYTQAAMGAALAVSQGFYSQLESGRRSLSDVPMIVKRLLIISANTIIPET